MLSGKRDSDPRPQPWQGCALPTELFPLVLTLKGAISLDSGCKGNAFFGTDKLFSDFFSKKRLIHPIFIIFVTKLAKDFQLSVTMEHADGWMRNAIKRVSLDRRVMDHIFKDDLLPDFQLMRELP